jgi:uncharacterized protein (TIGR00255 family)
VRAMIRSMTAFASAERATPWGVLTCELRAVNHRFLELGIRAPEELRALEPAVRERVSAKAQRGKMELGLRFRGEAAGASELRANLPLLGRLSELALDCQARFPAMHVEFTELLRFPGVIETSEIDQAGLQQAALALVEETIEEFCRAREREGAKLATAMRERLDAIEAISAQIKQWLPEIRAGLRARLDTRLAELKPVLEPGRIEQELVLWLQKLDVDEELDRLASHVIEARRVLGV